MNPLLTSTKNRYVTFPIVNKDVWDMYKKAESSFWTAEEVDLSKDINDWNALAPNEQHFLKHVLAFFAGSDGIVNDNLAARFMHEIVMPEARSFYAFQIAIESIHAETYSLLIDTYIKDTSESATLFDAIDNIDCVKKKATWAIKWIEDKEAPFAQRLFAFACVEGIFFSGAFCAIYWLNERGVLPGLCFSNELISRDEALHTVFAVLLYTRYVPDKMDEPTAAAIVMEAVNLKKEFITDAIPCQLVGMNKDSMIQYIMYVADRLLLQMGYSKVYNSKNPFPFMERISLEGKTNFFERRVSEYSLANVGKKMEYAICDEF
eukprot:gene19702-biopygen28526